MSGVITAASTPSTEPRTIHDVICEHIFTCSLHLQRYNCRAHVPRSVWRVFRLQPVGGAAAVVQVTGINKGKFAHIYQSALSLLVIDFTYLDGRDGDLVVKELAAVDSHSKRVSSISLTNHTVWR